MAMVQLPPKSFVFILFIAAYFGRACAFQIPSLPRGHNIVREIIGFDGRLIGFKTTTRPAFISQTRSLSSWERPPSHQGLRLTENEESSTDTAGSRSLLRKIRGVLGFPVRRLKRLFKKGAKEDPSTGSEDVTKDTIDKAETEPIANEVTDVDTNSVADEVTDADTDSDGVGAAEEGSEETADEPKEVGETIIASEKSPKGYRSTESARGVDLSGEWNIIDSDEFREVYDKYLTLLGQPLLVRSVATSIVPLTSEVTEQSDRGKVLLIRGRNVRGTWERSLDTREITRIMTADGEHVEAEAWWEDKGTVHRSWLRGVKKYGGGDFESKRYLEADGKVLVCESIFHPKDVGRQKAKVTWRFLRQGEKL